MGVFFDYFRAATDDAAADVFDWPAGPTCPPPGTEPKDSAELKNIDPHVMMGTLEALLTGNRYEDITARPRHAATLRFSDDGGQGVLTVTDEFTSALAAANDDQIRALAHPWSQTEEFWGLADPAELTELLQDLRDLAVRATQHQHHLYCWTSL
ncbi:hypothetical protein [Microbispora triticiradicis]|uniref:DUF1877 family protein n=2 Tax=Microbispora TaxID=2005 RepID=A0ABY3LSA0_9ACTN|nr:MULTISPECIES: hypothetical protein [Microbispora]TLP62487.1 hypothetical protein FED44_11170 [Microbispora fusca]TYB52006.1 hypothetical protein FXF59_25550 [Microbispora tritici]